MFPFWSDVPLSAWLQISAMFVAIVCWMTGFLVTTPGARNSDPPRRMMPLSLLQQSLVTERCEGIMDWSQDLFTNWPVHWCAGC